MVATRAAVDRCGPGCCDAPQRAAERRSTEPEDSHQGQRATGTKDPASGPQGAAATFGYVAAGAPLLVVASLAGRDDVDATTVSFFVAENLKLQKEEEAEAGGGGA